MKRYALILAVVATSLITVGCEQQCHPPVGKYTAIVGDDARFGTTIALNTTEGCENTQTMTCVGANCTYTHKKLGLTVVYNKPNQKVTVQAPASKIEYVRSSAYLTPSEELVVTTDFVVDRI